jgi:hypothetical protein
MIHQARKDPKVGDFGGHRLFGGITGHVNNVYKPTE